VSIYITLSSRVAVLGANGAGKSTMIRMLTGVRVFFLVCGCCVRVGADGVG
jgi:ABC-type uncharacterized transport system ATPase subunit